MNKKPRIAFCFSGQARTLDQTYMFFQKNLFDAAKEQGFDYDIFCAVEDDEDIDKVQLLNPTKVEKIKSSEVEKIINNKYGYFINNEMFKYCDFIHTGVYSVLQQLYKVQTSMKLAGQKKYDIVFRLRFDIIYLNKFNFSEIYNDVKKGFIICNYSYKHSGFFFKKIISLADFEDILYIGNNDIIVLFSNIFNAFKQVITSLGSNNTNKLSCFFWLLKKITELSININKKCHIIPINMVYYLKNIFGIKIFVGESYYNLFFKCYKQNLKPTEISKIIIRKKIKESQVQLYNKSIYEI